MAPKITGTAEDGKQIVEIGPHSLVSVGVAVAVLMACLTVYGKALDIIHRVEELERRAAPSTAFQTPATWRRIQERMFWESFGKLNPGVPIPDLDQIPWYDRELERWRYVHEN